MKRGAFWLSVFATAARWALVPLGAQTLGEWQRYREQRRNDPTVVAYYTFADLPTDTTTIPNERGDSYRLTFQLVPLPGQPEQKLEFVTGRWPEKKAVRLDMGRLEGPEIPVDNRQLTVSCWFRAHGPGVHRGNAGSTNGTLLSVGNGYWNGWRVTLWYPERRLGFEIGRPQPSPSYGIWGGRFVDGVWNHVAATWDGRWARLYLNGLLIAQGQYEGAYTAPPQDKHFRIGFADAGVGSVRADIDEVVIRNRALSPAEIWEEICFAATLSPAQQKLLQTAEEAAMRQDWAQAAASYRALAADKSLPPAWRPFVALRLGLLYQQLRQPVAAAQQLAQAAARGSVPEALKATALTILLQMSRTGLGLSLPTELYAPLLALPGLTPLDEFQLRLQLACSLAAQKQSGRARQEWERISSLEVPMQEKLNAGLRLAHASRAAGDYEGACCFYRAIRHMSEAPAEAIAFALFGIAEAYIAEKKWAEAAQALSQAAGLPKLPAHLREEALERKAELPYRRAGKPLPARARHISLLTLPKPAIELHVAPQGNDANPGTLQQPLGTLQAAQMKLRARRQNGVLPKGGAVIYIHGGEYRCAQVVLRLTAEDSGTPEAPIVYRAWAKERPRFIGARQIRGFIPVTDPAILARLPEEARGKVLQTDLRAQGITDLGQMSQRGMDVGTAPYTEVFWNGAPLRLARWPNQGWLRVGPIVSGGQGGQPTTFGIDFAERAARWREAKDPFAEGYWRFDWAEATLAVNKIDVAQKQMTILKPGGYGIATGQRYFMLNLLEEIDQPGEMYLDRETGILYVYPLSDPTTARVEFSVLTQPFVEATDCAWTSLQGLTFDICRGDAIVIRNSHHMLLAGCTITRPGQTGVIIDGGHDCGLFGCDIGWTGRGGTHIRGGDRKTLTPGRHFVENCHIHHFSRIERSYTPAVLLEGCGNRIAHNLMHDSPHHALRIEGNDHLIEFNEIHSVVYEGDDQGGLDIWGNPTYRGNVFRYNFWHHIGSGVWCGQAGIRLDDAISGVLIYGNIFYKCSEANFGAVQIHGGKDNIIDNNLFVDCQYAVSFSPWGQKRWEETLDGWAKAKIEEVNALAPPYSERYPELRTLRENSDVNSVWRNVVVRCGSFLTRDGGIQRLIDNLVLEEDPGFVAPERFNFGLKPTSSVFARTVFRRIPVEEIGPYAHPWRASWPIEHAISPEYKPMRP